VEGCFVDSVVVTVRIAVFGLDWDSDDRVRLCAGKDDIDGGDKGETVELVGSINLLDDLL
jgi:hypothetical protein